MRPVEMEKVSIAAHKKHLKKTIESLYRLKLLDVEEYDGSLETGTPFEEAEELSDMLVRTRSILSKLPEVEIEQDGSFQLDGYEERLDEISVRIDEIESEIAAKETEISDLEEQKSFLKNLKGSGISAQDLKGTANLSVKVLKKKKDFESIIETDRYEILDGQNYSALFYYSPENEEVERALGEAGSEESRVTEISVEGEIPEAIEDLNSRISKVDSEKEELQSDLEENAKGWRAELEAARKFLEEKVEKAEAPLHFATTDHAFVVEGWIPEEKFDELGEELYRVSGGKIHLQSEEAESKPPVELDNPGPVGDFESLTSLVSVPRYKEIDPTFLIFLTFPALFGFMIGDAGYGLTSALVFGAGYKYIDGAQQIFKSLLWASFFTFIFGLAFGDAFGYIIFGSHSALTAATGIGLFEQIPILFHRAEHLGDVFTIAAAFGFIHVNFGILLGFYNELIQHGLKEAFLAKISWFVLEIGALAAFAFSPMVGLPILLIGAVMLGIGEGVEGIVEIPSLIANILSYLRIFGVAVAAVSLAKVVNGMAAPLFEMGGATGIALGTLMLAVGHSFNTGIKIMEGFLQGIRLHYVEFFTKFYDGGGRRYVPFGTRT